ncbi:dephospho-CoA kinase [Amphritea sp. 2_MG-2023]|uniref:dephospho-CoA kinase n=1 Tax=Amphritea TaxID=515417 RepID=UPI001C06D9EE|nr:MULTISPECIES: dephospho-CoA kinase [Amphritea]MBU2965178.1 dephospho-CoA kinase [Amphritea atlantica]MDO6419753.1 dephospho-CoA kinase [Amphritea sp. 2_MG-2023]
MFVVGLTGGISSGKSAVSHLFEQLSVTVIDADQVAREVVEPGEPALEKITQRFGSEIRLANGGLDRKALRKIVFTDPRQRDWLEQLLHPLIRDRILLKLDQCDSDYAILASPLLLETDQHLLVNHIVVVDVDEGTQISRTVARDNTDIAQVKAIIAAQMPHDERVTKAHDLIDNSGSLADLKPQIEQLHLKFLSQAQQEQESDLGK